LEENTFLAKLSNNPSTICTEIGPGRAILNRPNPKVYIPKYP